MGKILSRMGFPHIDDKKLKVSAAALLIKLCEWRNLPHKGRSGDTAEFQEYVFLSEKIGQRNFRSIHIRECKRGCLRADFGNCPKVRRCQIALTKRFMIIVIDALHTFATLG